MQDQDRTGPSSGAEVVRRAYELVKAGRPGEAAELFARDVVWHFPGTSALAGDTRGRDAVMAIGPKFAALSDSIRVTLLDIAEGEKYVVAIQRTQAERDGRVLDHIVCELFTVRDGLIRDVSIHPYDVRVQDEFWT